MPAPKPRPRCPHCGNPLRAFAPPDNTGWEQPLQWACFNNDCSYYREGWSWMWEKYQVKASYRYRTTDPDSGQNSPLPVWSETALLERIVDDPESYLK